jgi:hypothetical protein
MISTRELPPKRGVSQIVLGNFSKATDSVMGIVEKGYRQNWSHLRPNTGFFQV